MTTRPPTIREVLERGLAFGLNNRKEIVGHIAEELEAAGITEASLDALISGEAVVVPTKVTTKMYRAAYESHASITSPLVNDFWKRMLQAAQEQS